MNKAHLTKLLEQSCDAVDNEVTLGREYAHCCWDVERVSIGYADMLYLTEEDKALMVALQVIYLDCKTNHNVYRTDELIRSMKEIRNKSIYQGKFSGYYDSLSIRYPNIKTTKVDVQELQTLTKQNIIDMHNRDSIAIFLANLIPTIGTGFSVLMEIIRQSEQNGEIDILGVAASTFLGEFIAHETKQLAGLLFSAAGSTIEVLNPAGKESYVKDGVRMVEGDVCIQIRLDYELGTHNMVYEFIVRQGVVISCKKHGPFDITEGEGGMHINTEPIRTRWKNEGYIADPT